MPFKLFGKRRCLQPDKEEHVMSTYIPSPTDTTDIVLSEDILALCEKMAENTHEVWAKNRIEQGWSYGPERNDERKENPCLVPYGDLPDSEKKYDRDTAMETLKLIIKLGYEIKKAE